MVMTKPPVTPIRLADMGRQEAEQITQTIKDNFDSLGAMLIQARDRKAYKALGYRTFESYCQTEFGKSVSSAYQLIEDAKVLSQLEARISENYGEAVTLNFPSSHLKPLKEIESVDDKLKAIEYAQKLAATENRKATKKDLEIAVFQISGKRSDDFRDAIQGLGFSRGVPVEVTKNLKKDRGFVTKVDKLGKVYVEFYYGGNTPVPFDATDLRLLGDAEKPTNPASDDTLSKGDIVRIFAKGLEGKTGEIFIWKPGKQVSVLVEGETLPTDIAYAELEFVKRPKQKNANWESELVWESGKNTYYYFPGEDTIQSNRWPTGLTLKPYTHSGTPIEFVENWENRFSPRVLEALATPDRLKTLVLEQASEQGQEFAADLVNSLLQLLDTIAEPLSQKSLGISFAQTIDELISGKKTQTRRAWQDDYAKNFIRYFDENIPIPALDKGRHRGGHELGFIRLTQRPYQQYLSEMTATDLQEEGGMVATAQEFIDTFFEGQDKLVWVLHFEFLPSHSDSGILQENQRLRQQLLEAETAIQSMITASRSSAPGDTASHADFLVENTSEISAPGDLIHTDWKSILISNNFSPNYHYTDECTEVYRGWKIYLDPNGGFNYVDLNHPEKGSFCCDVNWLNIESKLENEDDIVNWAKGIVNQIEDFCPGQLSLFPTAPDDTETSPPRDAAHSETTIEALKQDNDAIISAKRERVTKILEQEKQNLSKTNNEKTRTKIKNNIRYAEEQLEDLDKFKQFRIGDTIIKTRFPDEKGTLTKLEITPTGMPLAWVEWPNQYEEEPSTPEQHPLGVLTNLSQNNEEEK